MRKAKDVDEYIANAPQESQDRLKKLRKIIQETVPQAVEKISYGMPYYEYKGRLAYFAGYKHHVGLYITPPVIRNHQNELKEYGTSMATIRFLHKEKFPLPLIKKLVKARVKINDQIKKEK